MKSRLKRYYAIIPVLIIMLITSCGVNTKSNIENVSNISASSSSESMLNNENETVNSDTAKQSAKATSENSSAIESQQSQQVNLLQLTPGIEKVKVRAVYLTGPSAGSSAKVDKIIELAKKTELNAVVVDIKEDGAVNYASNLDLVKKYGRQTKYYDAQKVVKKFHDNGVYVIGRIVTFKDPTLAKSRADLAIKNSKGTLWLENGKTPWANPYNEEVWDYNIAIAKEAITKGFDEIQFDYVRFPTGRKSDFNYGNKVSEKAVAINGFLAKAQKELYDGLRIPVSADVFAIITESKADGESIGQRITEVGKDIYCISPMIYPSHYANNASRGIMSNGVGQEINGVMFKKPDLEPYKVMYNALLSTKTKISAVNGYKAKVRPYLQAFTAKYLPSGYYQTYGAAQVKEQIKAVYDSGYEEWILWDPSNKYQESYFNAEN